MLGNYVLDVEAGVVKYVDQGTSILVLAWRRERGGRNVGHRENGVKESIYSRGETMFPRE